MKSYKTIPLILLLIFLPNFIWSQVRADSLRLNLESEIDFIVEHAILHKAFPGCVVYASQSGKPFLFKSYGFHTYDSLIAVDENHIYDLASITKVTGSTLALMKLYDYGLFQLEDQLGDYISGLGSRVGKLTFREVLAHNSGLSGWIKYYEKVKKPNGNYKRHTISSEQSEKYPFQISEGMFLHEDFSRKVKHFIRKSSVNENPEYLYSGLFFYLVPELVKNLSGQDFETFLDNQFYKPLGAETITFNPLSQFDPELIVPTEIDTFFRMQPIHGMVHDEGAIFMKGVSGNAGLFGNAQDLAKCWQVLLEDGEMSGTHYLNKSTISLFTEYQYPGNRRGLGFDKPLLVYDSIKSSVARSASSGSYGHTGYTGTLVWADPETDLLFIFLSNRVYPNRKQRSIYDLNVRPEIHEKLYEFIEAMTQDPCIKIEH